MNPDPPRVLVTGAGSGIGASIAIAFAERGSPVFICDRDEASILRLNGYSPGIDSMCADVGEPHAPARIVAAAEAAMGGVDVLINNAGIAGPTANIDDMPVDDWRACIEVNLTAPFLFMQAVIPQFRKRLGGSVINVSSISTVHAIPRRSAYVASKCGLEGLTRSAARELGPMGIRCNAILPGFVDNERSRTVLQKAADARGVPADVVEQEALSFISLRRKIGMNEIAAACVFLASPEAAAITGQLIRVDANVEWEG